MLTSLIVGGWILIVAKNDQQLIVVPTQYATKALCQSAAEDALKAFSGYVYYSCLKAGDGIN